MRHFESIPRSSFSSLRVGYSLFLTAFLGSIPLRLQADPFQTNTGQINQPVTSAPIVPLKNATLAPDVHITWFGQACFGFHSRSGDSLLTDPYNPDMTGYPAPTMVAKVVTISHEHPDHNDIQVVSGNPIVIRQAGVTGAGGLVLRGIQSWHDNAGGETHGPNLIFTWTMEGIRFAHLGDLGQHQLTPAQRKAIGPVDVLLIPVGGTYTINGTEAQEIIKELQPRMVIPMHYKTDVLKIPLDPIDRFLAGSYPVVKTGKSDLLLSRASLPSKTTIFVMDYAHTPTAGGMR